MAELSKPDLCIIGAGSLGVELACRARRYGASVVLVDRGHPEAGDGVAQTAALAALAGIAARAHSWRTGPAVGLAGDPPKINHRTVSEQVSRVVAELAPERSTERLQALGIVIRTGAPAFADKQTLVVGQTTIRADHFILATGATPKIPAIPGLEDVPFFTPDTIVANTRKLTHLVVIGGDAAALELAQVHARLGSQVTLTSPGAILSEADAESRAILLRALAEEGIAFHENVEITVLPRKLGIGVQFQHSGGETTLLDASHLLVTTGRIPDLEGLDLAKAGIARPDQQPEQIKVSAVGRTTNNRVSAVGGATNENHPHAARRAGEALLGRLLLGKKTSNSKLAPTLVMTSPELAQIGLTEPHDGASGQQILRANWSENPKARALGAAHGAAKLVVNNNGTLAGAALVGIGAAEMLAIIVLAMERRLHVAELAQLVLPHPSFAEVLRSAAEQFEGKTASAPATRRRLKLPRLLG
ncbi:MULTISPECIES: NAD(P)/FAD-dependent oxidoreductase [unclassified Devosia]|uniref:FAD-dependent oxidoreductase n=1 Tax=unclassified Devosia TaxID=196773 RepID=UPI001554BCE2|nr:MULTISPECIES: NAD(P)/FAD-dependent oxidoreductase [unclassified Devosia]